MCLTDREVQYPLGPRQVIRAALIPREVPGAEASPRTIIDIRIARALTQALEQAGIRPSQQARRVGDYVLGELLADGPGYQDWLAEHTTLAGVHGRVRQYLVAQAASEEERQRWVCDRAVTALSSQIVQEAQATGGVMTLDELIDALLATRTTSVTDERAQRQLAAALVRTACALWTCESWLWIIMSSTALCC